MKASFASQRRVADFDQRVKHRLQVESRSADDLSTSAVAVCCWSDSRSSLSSRVFSMAMTAWAAKFLHQLDLLVGEWTHLLAIDGEDADQLVLLEHRHVQTGSESAEVNGSDENRFAFDVGWSALISAICIVRFVSLTRPKGVRGPGRCGPRCQNSANAGGTPTIAAARMAPSSLRNRMPKWLRRCAPHFPAWPGTRARVGRANC